MDAVSKSAYKKKKRSWKWLMPRLRVEGELFCVSERCWFKKLPEDCREGKQTDRKAAVRRMSGRQQGVGQFYLAVSFSEVFRWKRSSARYPGDTSLFWRSLCFLGEVSIDELGKRGYIEQFRRVKKRYNRGERRIEQNAMFRITKKGQRYLGKEQETFGRCWE